jgi:hypothetical protein
MNFLRITIIVMTNIEQGIDKSELLFQRKISLLIQYHNYLFRQVEHADEKRKDYISFRKDEFESQLDGFLNCLYKLVDEHREVLDAYRLNQHLQRTTESMLMMRAPDLIQFLFNNNSKKKAA